MREKPIDEEQCRSFLYSYNHHPAEAVVGIVVVNTGTGKRVEGVATAKQYFREINEDTVTSLLQQGDVMYCAGGFVVEQMNHCVG